MKKRGHATVAHMGQCDVAVYSRGQRQRANAPTTNEPRQDHHTDARAPRPKREKITKIKEGIRGQIEGEKRQRFTRKSLSFLPFFERKISYHLIHIKDRDKMAKKGGNEGLHTKKMGQKDSEGRDGHGVKTVGTKKRQRGGKPGSFPLLSPGIVRKKQGERGQEGHRTASESATFALRMPPR